MSDTNLASKNSAPETQLDEDDLLKKDFVQDVLRAVEAGDAEQARALVSPLHPADIADLFELTPADQRRALAASLAEILDADVIAEMNEHVREEFIDELEPQKVAEIASEMDTDDAVAIIEDMEEDDQRAVLRALAPDDRAAIEEALSYPADSAGRLMQRELVAIPEHWTVGQVIDFLRDNKELTTDFWEVYVVDPTHKPIGCCQLSWVLRSPRKMLMSEVMKREQTLIPVTMDQEEVALRFQKYALISAAVVDASGRLVGMITVDDIVHVIQEEAGEDILRLSNAGDGDINEPIWQTIKARFFWLIINMGTEILAALVISFYKGTIERNVALAAIMVIIAGMGGNAGTQTMAVIVRAYATNQLSSSNTRWQILREFYIAAVNGAVLGAILAIGVFSIYHDQKVAIASFFAIIVNSLVAGMSGILIPVGLHKMKIDPAIVSTVFVTMMTDVMGFLALLGLATLLGI